MKMTLISRKIARRAAMFLALVVVLLCVAVAWLGRAALNPPGWLAVLVIGLPWLYLTALAGLAVLWVWLRTWGAGLLMAGLALSAGLLWGPAWWPRPETPPDPQQTLTVMTWNVQRLGQYAGGALNRSRYADCVSRTIADYRPDLLALLEITAPQLRSLQRRLAIQPQNCVWTDYYGTRRGRRGGLAICLNRTDRGWRIRRRRTLDLPPDWKYLFLELTTPFSGRPPLNLLAVHIVPPNVTDTQVSQVAQGLLHGRRQALRDAFNLLQVYERRVALQNRQALQTLAQIRRFNDPTLIAGDFNSTPDAALHAQLRTELIDAWRRAGLGWGATRRWADWLPLRIDYVYADPAFGVAGAQTPAAACSDHQPVVATLFLKDQG